MAAVGKHEDRNRGRLRRMGAESVSDFQFKITVDYFARILSVARNDVLFFCWQAFFSCHAELERASVRLDSASVLFMDSETRSE